MKKIGMFALLFMLCFFVLSGCSKDNREQSMDMPENRTEESQTPYNGQPPTSPTNNNATTPHSGTGSSLGEDIKEDISKGISDVSDAVDSMKGSSGASE